MDKYYVKETEYGLWTIGCGEGPVWYPVKDFDNPKEANDTAARLNNPYLCELIDNLQTRVNELEALVATLGKNTLERIESLEEQSGDLYGQYLQADLVKR